MHEAKDSQKIVIYYNASDVFLGTALLILVIFFIHDYLPHSLGGLEENSRIYMNQPFSNQSKANNINNGY